MPLAQCLILTMYSQAHESSISLFRNLWVNKTPPFPQTCRFNKQLWMYICLCVNMKVVRKILQHFFYFVALQKPISYCLTWFWTKFKCKLLSQVYRTQLLKTDPVALTQTKSPPDIGTEVLISFRLCDKMAAIY